MRKYALGLCLFMYCLCFGSAVLAQSKPDRAVIAFYPNIQGRFWVSGVNAVPLSNPEPFLSFFAIWEGPATGLEVSFSADGEHWEPWQALVRDAHNPDKLISELVFAESHHRFFQLAIPYVNGIYNKIECHFYNPGKTADMGNADGLITSRACPCTQPSYFTRHQWCPNDDCPPNPNPSSTVVKHLIVHHSAGANTSSDWAAVVRSIWNFHVNGNGWADIGYNWLIDPTGQVYEGRGDNILGAHFCGTNGGTMGTCMLGTFTSVTPPQPALNSLKALLAWKACDADILPLDSAFHASSGLVLNRISGHRDGCSTECPGTQLYDLLPVIRQEVSTMISNQCSPLLAPANLEAHAVGATSIRVDWTDNSDNESFFLLERTDANGEVFSFLTTVPADSTGYNNTGLIPGATYFYRLRAVVGQDSSAFSNEASATTLTTDIEDIYFNRQTVRLSPNPASARLQVSVTNALRGEVYAEVINYAGLALGLRRQLEKNGDSLQFDINIQALPAGQYFLRIKLGSATGVLPFLKLNR